MEGVLWFRLEWEKNGSWSIMFQSGVGMEWEEYNGSSRNGRSVLAVLRPAGNCRLEPLVRRLRHQ